MKTSQYTLLDIAAEERQKQINKTFKKEWSQQEFKAVERKIASHFIKKQYNHIKQHGEQPRPLPFYSFSQIDNFLGLAYTSTGDYAGLWVCNGGYLYADNTHTFIGFAINELNEVIGIADDENENSIYIKL